MDHVDVLIIGAGLSGIGAAAHLGAECPGKTYAILEARDAIGGTWDLFRYPGIRSDSDMFTLGFPFRPWRGSESIASGAEIREYVEDTAREEGVLERLHLGQRVERVEWSSARGTSGHDGSRVWPFSSMKARKPSRSSALVCTLGL